MSAAMVVVPIIFMMLGYLKEVDVWMQLASIIAIVSMVLMWDAYGQTYSRLAGFSDQPVSFLSKRGRSRLKQRYVFLAGQEGVAQAVVDDGKRSF